MDGSNPRDMYYIQANISLRRSLFSYPFKKKMWLLENLLGSSTCFVAGRVTGVLLHLIVPNGVAIRRMIGTALSKWFFLSWKELLK